MYIVANHTISNPVDAVKQFVETLTSAFARNDYMIVESANAMGLPR